MKSQADITHYLNFHPIGQIVWRATEAKPVQSAPDKV